MKLHVVIVGGGVAGMTAAHELVERGFEVTVLERDVRPGGKAKTYDAPAPTSPRRQPLPGEHGFRFFPHFYRNTRDTMGRIVSSRGRGTVCDDLVSAPSAMLARVGLPPITLPTAPGGPSLSGIEGVIRAIFDGMGTGLTAADYLFFAEKILQIMSVCPKRALDEFENETWFDFLDGNRRSPTFCTYLIEGLTSCLVAARAKEANVRAGGVVLTQLVYGLLQGARIDWLLNGPTSPTWLDPWHAQLVAAGVTFKLQAEVTAWKVSSGLISGVEYCDPGGNASMAADYYLGCVPVEVMTRLWSTDMQRLDPAFAANLQSIALDVGWMTGIQYFMELDAPITAGHITFIDSPWALTAISQPQFWPGVDLGQYGDGTLKGILSVDISEWECVGICGRTAMQCTADQIAEEVWQQMVQRLNVDGAVRIPPNVPRYRMIDPNVRFNPLPVSNDAGLYLNKKGSWARRPSNKTPLSNLLLASDYVRTSTNLATMEAANESARHAVQLILDRSGVGGQCLAYPLPDPFAAELELARRLDCLRYESGMAWVTPIV